MSRSGGIKEVATLVATLLALAILTIVPAQAAPTHAGELTEGDVEAWLDGAVPALLKREGIPGAAVSVVHDGEILTARGYGVAEVATADAPPVPVDPRETLLRVGSISKVPLAVAVMQLADSGELDLDEPITTYTDLAPAPTFDPPVTMRHLLTHTAGYEEAIRGTVRSGPARMPPLGDYLRAMAPEQIYAPGTVPAYSNYGYALAAHIVEEVSGQEAGEYLQTQVLEPAGATTATYDQPLPSSVASRAALPYPTVHEDPIGFELVGPWPAGSLSASAVDMGEFMRALLDQEDSPILSSEAMSLLFAPGLTAEQLGALAAGHQMTLGMFEQDRNGHRILGHGGDVIHSHAAFQIYPEEGTGIFIGLNGTGRQPDSSVVLRSGLFDDFTDRYYPPTSDPVQVQATSGDHAAAAAGRYITSRRGESSFMRAYSLVSTVTVRSAGDTLVIPALTDASGHPLELRETEPWLFQDPAGTHRLAVATDDSGEVEAISLMPAATLLPAPAWYLPLLLALVVALVVVAIALVSWPARAVIGWRLGRPLVLPRTDRRLRRASLLAAVFTYVGVGLWAMVASSLLNGQADPLILIRSAQIATLLSVLGLVPAGWRALRAWRQRSWLQAVLATLMLAAFTAIATFALAGGLLIPRINY